MSESKKDRCTHCFQPKAKAWHLVCPACWRLLPDAMRDELGDALQQEQGSKRHIEAVRTCLRELRRLDRECPRCGSSMSDCQFDEDIGKWWQCSNCYYQWTREGQKT